MLRYLAYGTSITQGACASRPGMVHTAILGRRFDRPVINLGFSGNGRMETEVVELMAELDAAVYVIDCLPNITAQEVLARTKPCIQILRKAHPQTPVLLVEDRSYADSFLISAKRERNRTSRQALWKVYEELKTAGDKYLYYLEGEQLLGDDNEAWVPACVSLLGDRDRVLRIRAAGLAQAVPGRVFRLPVDCRKHRRLVAQRD